MHIYTIKSILRLKLSNENNFGPVNFAPLKINAEKESYYTLLKDMVENIFSSFMNQLGCKERNKSQAGFKPVKIFAET